LNQILKLRARHRKCTLSSLPRKAAQFGMLNPDQ
jgi:hypothetical protein